MIILSDTDALASTEMESTAKAVHAWTMVTDANDAFSQFNSQWTRLKLTRSTMPISWKISLLQNHQK